MTVCVFVGPTLRPEEVEAALPGAMCLPPVAQGDVYRAAASHPRAVGIIDGYFSGAPSVWHKEILWALSEGVHVFGSASMGALRAAEMHPYGMRGVGRIFEAFRDGVLEDDDEVAVVHGPPETGFLAASEPMVNIRATLDRAEALGVLGTPSRAALEAIAKAKFFPHRTWPGVLKAAAADGMAGAELSTLKEWLRTGSVDRKREDALEMLAAMRDTREVAQPFAPAFRFERTHFWDDLVGRAALEQAGAGVAQESILDELRLQGPGVYEKAEKNALLRLLAVQDAMRRGLILSTEALGVVSADTRMALELFSRGELDAWMAESGLDDRSYGRLMESEAQLRSIAAESRGLIASFLLDELRLSGLYQRLSARAREKAETLAEAAAGNRDRPTAAPNTAELRVWFFEERLGQPIPEDVAAFAVALGFSSLAEFERALQHEWLYARLAGEARPTPDRGA